MPPPPGVSKITKLDYYLPIVVRTPEVITTQTDTQCDVYICKTLFLALPSTKNIDYLHYGFLRLEKWRENTFTKWSIMQ